MAPPAPSLPGNPFPGPSLPLCLCCPWRSLWPCGPCWSPFLSFWFYYSISFLGLCVFCIPPSFHVIFPVLISDVWLTSSLSPSPTVSKLGAASSASSLGSLQSTISLQPLGPSLGGLLPLGQAELLLAGIGVAPPPGHVVGRTGPAQAGPPPGCHPSPSAWPPCLGEAVAPQGAELGATADICSHLVWERSLGLLWLTLGGEQDSLFVISFQRRRGGVSV